MAEKYAEIIDEFAPQSTPFLIGHDSEQQIFLDCYKAGRLHHAWLLIGPKGIGKATLAYHYARFLLKGGQDQNLNIPATDPIFMHVASGTEANLKTIKCEINEKTGRQRTEIIVKDIRKLQEFFHLTAAQEGWRIAIIDGAEDMNKSASNALLKILEEPPKKSIFFLITHSVGRLLPTIRSRCQLVGVSPLNDMQVEEVLTKKFPNKDKEKILELAHQFNRSPGLAVRMGLLKDTNIFKEVKDWFDGQKLKTKAKHEMATYFSKPTAQEHYFLFLEIFRNEIVEKTRTLATQNAKQSQIDCWLGLWEKVNRMSREGEGLNLGRKAQVLLLLEALENARKSAAAA